MRLDRDSRQVEPIGIPAAPDRGILTCAAQFVTLASLHQHAQPGVTDMKPVAMDALRESSPSRTVQRVGGFVKSLAVVEDRKQPDDNEVRAGSGLNQPLAPGVDSLPVR